ncbi:MAG: GNAT family N-acetyltransferase [Candidatus Dormiibacterota bacterium]
MDTSHNAPITPELASPADAPALRALYAAGGWRPQSRSVQELKERIGHGEVALLREDGRVVASVAVTWEDSVCWGAAGRDGTAGYVHALVRDRERTASGLGLRLLVWAENRIVARGRHLSRLDTVAERTPLLRYYQAHGYRMVDTRTYRWAAHALTLFERRLP